MTACVEKSGKAEQNVVRRRFIRTQDPAALTIECDSDQDGRADYREREQYDERGLLTLWELDDNADGNVDGRVEPKSRRGSSPELPAREYHTGGFARVEELDPNRDGRLDWRAGRRYDESGNLVFFEWSFADPSAPSTERALACDAKGRGRVPGCRAKVDHEWRGFCEPFEHQKTLEYECLADVHRRAPKRAFAESHADEGDQP